MDFSQFCLLLPSDLRFSYSDDYISWFYDNNRIWLTQFFSYGSFFYRVLRAKFIGQYGAFCAALAAQNNFLYGWDDV